MRERENKKRGIKRQNKNANDLDDSAAYRVVLQVYFQGFQDTDAQPIPIKEGSALGMELVEAILGEPYYHELRTCEQLG